jgi:phage/plasmid primase-like uncharacterized protein
MTAATQPSRAWPLPASRTLCRAGDDQPPQDGQGDSMSKRSGRAEAKTTLSAEPVAEVRRAAWSTLGGTGQPSRTRAPGFISAAAAQAEFAEALRRAGLKADGPPTMDGNLHRVPVDTDRRGKKSGAYIGHLDAWPAGFLCNFKTGEVMRWRASGATRALSAAERSQAQAETARRQRERERVRHAEEEAVAERVRVLWRQARPAYRHPYLERKGVAEHGLRVDAENRLLVPMYDTDGVIWSLQTISPAGNKLYAKGGRKQGLHLRLGDLTSDAPLVIAEGFATAATVHEATGLPTIAAFDAGNLLAVAEAFRTRHPGRQIMIVAGDNDHHLPRLMRADGTSLPNVGKEKAEAAALAINGLALIPPFADEATGTDWNDYAAIHGLDAVRQAVAEPLARFGITLRPLPRETYRAAPPSTAGARQVVAPHTHTEPEAGLRGHT